jgi:hypothetical protein
VPAGGLANRSRAALGIGPAGITTGLPGVWLNSAAERASSPLPSAVRKRGPKLRGGVRSPNREPRWSAERRARRSQGALPHPYRCGHGWMRLSALRFPFLRVRLFLAVAGLRSVTGSRACAPRGRARISSSPAVAGEVRRARHGGRARLRCKRDTTLKTRGRDRLQHGASFR